MKWFSKTEFDAVRKLIDSGNNAKAIGDWYWTDFKNNATTLAMLFVYSTINRNKCPKCIGKLKDLLIPKGKTGPLEFNDVISEIWHHDSTKAVKSISVIIDAGIPFSIKNGKVLKEFLTNPDLTKFASTIENNPSIISKYIKKPQLDKIQKLLLASDNYDLVKKALSSVEFSIRNKSYNRNYHARRNSKVTLNTLLKKTSDIKNKTLRMRYITEQVFQSNSDTVSHLFDELLELYLHTDFDANNIVAILMKLTRHNSSTGTAIHLFHQFYLDGADDAVKTITTHWDESLWRDISLEIIIRNGKGKVGEIPYATIWITHYIDIIDDDRLMKMIPSSKNNDGYVAALINKFPECVDLISEMYPHKLPKSVQDVFVF